MIEYIFRYNIWKLAKKNYRTELSEKPWMVDTKRTNYNQTPASMCILNAQIISQIASRCTVRTCEQVLFLFIAFQMVCFVHRIAVIKELPNVASVGFGLTSAAEWGPPMRPPASRRNWDSTTLWVGLKLLRTDKLACANGKWIGHSLRVRNAVRALE